MEKGRPTHVSGSTSRERGGSIELALRDLLQNREDDGEQGSSHRNILISCVVTTGEDACALLHHTGHVGHHPDDPGAARKNLKIKKYVG